MCCWDSKKDAAFKNCIKLDVSIRTPFNKQKFPVNSGKQLGKGQQKQGGRPEDNERMLKHKLTKT